PTTSTLFPYTTLFRSHQHLVKVLMTALYPRFTPEKIAARFRSKQAPMPLLDLILKLTVVRVGGGAKSQLLEKAAGFDDTPQRVLDRKSTRLNSSHLVI